LARTLRPTLAEFLRHSGVSSDLASVISAAARGSVEVAGALKGAGLSGTIGATGETNAQGEAVKRMDVIANEILVETFRRGGEAAILASEETPE